MWENVKLTLKFKQFYPQFETCLPFKSLSCQFFVAKKPLRIIEYLQHHVKTALAQDLVHIHLERSKSEC